MEENKKNCEVKMPDQTAQPFWNIAGCSVVGTSHMQSEEPCHDSFSYNSEVSKRKKAIIKAAGPP